MIAIAAVCAVLGLLVGSFLSVVTWRVRRGCVGGPAAATSGRPTEVVRYADADHGLKSR